MIQRIKKVIDEKTNGVERVFAEKIGIKQATLNNYTRCKRDIGLPLIEAIITTYEDISADWLLTGAGNMYKQDLPSFSGNESENELELQSELTKRTIELEECQERLEEAYKTIEDLRYMVSLQKDKIRTLENMERRDEKKVV